MNTPELHQDAWLAMREAWQRLNELDELSPNVEAFKADAARIARACRHHLYRIRPFFLKIRGRGTFHLEDALGRTEALLIAIHAIAVTHAEDPDAFEAGNAISFLTRMLGEHTAEGAADRWAELDQADQADSHA